MWKGNSPYYFTQTSIICFYYFCYDLIIQMYIHCLVSLELRGLMFHGYRYFWCIMEYLTLNTVNYITDYKIYSLFVSYLGYCSTEEDQNHNEASLHIAYPLLSIPFLSMPWRCKEPENQKHVIDQINLDIPSLASEEIRYDVNKYLCTYATHWHPNENREGLIKTSS